MNRDGSEARLVWRLCGLFVVLLLAVIWGRQFFLLPHRHFGADEVQHVHRAWCGFRGLVPYRDFFDHHTPWFHFALAPLFRLFSVETSADDAEAFLLTSRVLMWVVGSMVLVLTFVLGREWRDTTTGLLAALFLAVSGFFGAKAIEIRPDGVSIILWLGCLLILLRVARRDRPASMPLVLAGLCFGAGVMTNLKLLLAVPGVAAALLWREVPGGRARDGMISLLWFAAAAVAPAAATGAWFAARGAFGELFHQTLVIPILDWPQRVPLWPIVRRLIEGSPLVAAVGVLGFCRTLTGLYRPGPRSAEDGLLVLVAASLAAGALLVREPWPQYFLIPLPVFAVLGSGLVVEAARRIDPRAAPAIVIAAALLAMTSALAKETPLRHNHHQLTIIRYVIENTTPDETIMNGWGNHGGLFRPHAFRIPFLPHGWLPLIGEAERAQLLHDLETCQVRPAIIFFDAYVRRLSPEITRWIRDNYKPVGIGSMWRPSADCRKTSGSLRSAERSDQGPAAASR